MSEDWQRYTEWCFINLYDPHNKALWDAWRASQTYNILYKVEGLDNYDQLRNAAIEAFRKDEK